MPAATKEATEVAIHTPAPLPAMYNPADIRSSDIKIPSIYTQQGLSQLVQSGDTKIGDVVVALSADDDEFEWLIGGPEKLESFVAFVIGLKRTVIRQPQGEQMTFLPNNYERAEGERDVWVGYTYLLAIPALELFRTPCRLMAIKTAGRGVFTKVNHMLETARLRGDGGKPLAVRFTAKEDTGTKSGQKYYKLVPGNVDAADLSEDDLATAEDWLREFASMFTRDEVAATPELAHATPEL